MDEVMVELELDTDALAELSGDEQVAYEDVRVWGRSNHLAVRRGTTTRREIDLGRRAVWEVPLQCLAHPHPECRFRYVTISVDFRRAADGTDQEGVRVEDLSPRSVEGKDPVRIVTKRSGDLSFELETVGLGASVTAESSREAQVYFPVVRGSAPVDGLAVWDFRPLPGGPLHVDRDLLLLVSGPAAPLGGLNVEFRVQAGVDADGLRGLVPLVGRRSVELTAEQQLN